MTRVWSAGRGSRRPIPGWSRRPWRFWPCAAWAGRPSAGQGGRRADPRPGSRLRGLELWEQVRFRDRAAPAARPHGARPAGPGRRRCSFAGGLARLTYLRRGRPGPPRAGLARLGHTGPAGSPRISRRGGHLAGSRPAPDASASPTPPWGWRSCCWRRASRHSSLFITPSSTRSR